MKIIIEETAGYGKAGQQFSFIFLSHIFCNILRKLLRKSSISATVRKIFFANYTTPEQNAFLIAPVYLLLEQTDNHRAVKTKKNRGDYSFQSRFIYFLQNANRIF
ncbi:hypothetical protein HY546_03200 [archaeon]|nr:hypothetical protein [archaeon]